MTKTFTRLQSLFLTRRRSFKKKIPYPAAAGANETIAGHEKDEIDGKNNARDIQEIPEPFTVDTAANNIRHMSNSDAKTIPFIAMTANAFDDDMEKEQGCRHECAFGQTD